MLMHKGMAKQRLMRLIKCKKKCWLERIFGNFLKWFLMLEKRMNLFPGKKIYHMQRHKACHTAKFPNKKTLVL